MEMEKSDARLPFHTLVKLQHSKRTAGLEPARLSLLSCGEKQSLMTFASAPFYRVAGLV